MIVVRAIIWCAARSNGLTKQLTVMMSFAKDVPETVRPLRFLAVGFVLFRKNNF